ncbi:MAG: type II toxin-antitoxin system RelE family toxin [Sphingosinicella sp.]
MTTYRLVFKSKALKEWKRLGSSIREQFAMKLVERLNDPHIASARLRDLPGCYKIKLRAAGYRLIYRVVDDRLVVIVVAVGRRDRNQAYKIAAGRLS